MLSSTGDIMYGNLKGKISLVTGGAGGIGQALCRKLAELGSFVYICDLKEGKETADSINAQQSEERAVFVKADISNKLEVRKMFDRILKEKGGVDILVNNAAIYPPPPNNFQEISYENFRRAVSIDLSGAVYCSIAAISQVKKKCWGRIMFSAAPLSSSGIPAPYLAGKSGFIGLTKYLSWKLKKYGIGTFAIALRHVDTPMIRKVMKDRGKDISAGLKKLDKESVTGKIATSQEIADIFAYFALPKSDCMSGLVLLADGGITYLR